MNRPLDDIGVRLGVDGCVEFATFANLEYCESVRVPLERALGIYAQLHAVLISSRVLVQS
jgi:hypothetical protein